MRMTFASHFRSGFALLLAAYLCGVWGVGKAVAADAPGLEAGKKAPEFKLEDQNGRSHDLSGYLKKGKVALVFYRSADW